MIQGSGPFRATRQKPSRPFHAIFKITVGNRRDRSMLQPLKNGYSPEPPANVRNRSWKLQKRYSVGTVATVPRCIQDYSREPSRPFPQNWILALFSPKYISIYIHVCFDFALEYVCIYTYIHIIVTYVFYMNTIHHYMCIQVYTYVISYLLKKLPRQILEHKPAIYNSMILFPTSSLILGFGV